MNQVVHLQRRNGERQHEQLLKTVDLMSFGDAVRAALRAARLPFSRHQEGEPLPRDSWPAQMGHETLSGFITSSQEEGGLGWEWSQWDLELRAEVIRERFAVPQDEARAAIEEYEGIVDALGREPVDANEYHESRDGILREQFRQQEKATAIRRAELQEKVHTLMAQTHESRELLRISEGEVSRLKAEVAAAEEKYKEQIAGIREEGAQELKKTQEYWELEASRRVDDVRRSMQSLIDETLAKYNDGNYVRREHYEEALGAVEAEQDRSKVLIDELRVASERTEALQAEVAAASREIAINQRALAEANESTLRLQAQIVDLEACRDEADQRGQASRLASVERVVQRLKKRIEGHKSAASNHREQYESLSQRYRSLKSQYQLAFQELEETQGKLARAEEGLVAWRRHARKAMGFAGICASIFFAAAVWVIVST